MKLAIVVQRYGADINGGAELHARYIAERLARHAEVRVLTTCARDYITWRNDFPEGEEQVNGVPVERFTVSRERELHDFDRHSARVFHHTHSVQHELDWLESEGPVSPGLLARVRQLRAEFDYFLFFSARYHQAYHGARTVADRAILVPTAEREAAMGLGIMPPVFRGARAIMYNSNEERALIQTLAGNQDVPGVVVGVGSEIPRHVSAERARQAFGLRDPFVVYAGRIDVNKGCAELFDFFTQYATGSRPLDLVLIGNPVLPIPAHPRIRHLGYVTDQDKFDVMSAAEALVMPSYYESLSMVALEAWALGRPVLANAHCDVLKGQCLRSNAGLYYEDAREFAAALDTLRDDPAIAAALGCNGRAYFERHYTWPVIERTYLDMFERLSSEPPDRRATREMEPLPGWLGRRVRNLPPAAGVIAAVPSGPVLA